MGAHVPEPGGHRTQHTPRLGRAALCTQAKARHLRGFVRRISGTRAAWLDAVLKERERSVQSHSFVLFINGTGIKRSEAHTMSSLENAVRVSFLLTTVRLSVGGFHARFKGRCALGHRGWTACCGRPRDRHPHTSAEEDFLPVNPLSLTRAGGLSRWTLPSMKLRVGGIVPLPP